MKRFGFMLTMMLSGVMFFLTACRPHDGIKPPGPDGGTLPPDGGRLPPRIDGSHMERDKFEHVYFAYDSAAVNPHEGPKLDTVANFLRSDATAVILVEGHCDERGTAEYNRALGERRALAAREALIARGADGARIQTISYGKDKPADPSHGEASWSKNRRAEFVIVRP